jgi:molecular chaperone GrpE
MTKDQERTSVEEPVEEQDIEGVGGFEAESEPQIKGEATESGTAPAEEMSTEIGKGITPAEEEEQVDELTSLREQLIAAQTKADQYLDGWQRARAEFVNYRRREEQRRKQVNVEIKSRVLSDLLPVLDDLARVFEAIPEDMCNNSWIEGLSLIGQKLQTALAKGGLSVIPVDPGDTFDPNYHEALTHEPSKDFEDGQIIQVAQQGYKLDDIVLRPALVRVSNGRVDKDE